MGMGPVPGDDGHSIVNGITTEFDVGRHLNRSIFELVASAKFLLTVDRSNAYFKKLTMCPI